MSAKANYFKIGIFVISATIIAIIAIVALGVGTFFQKKIDGRNVYRWFRAGSGCGFSIQVSRC